PLDLLLYLIRKEKVDIYDIPISRITDQYLESIEAMERLDLDLDRAGDYLLMAATLMRIKARLLVPRDEGEEVEEDEIDPREELVRRLVEYREFKRVSEALRMREEEWREVFFRAGSLRPETPQPEGFTDLGVSIVDLFRAFRRMVAKLEEEKPLRMTSEEYTVDERMDAIRDLIAEGDGAPFTKLFGDSPTRPLLVATFLGLLELIRLREIMADQADRFGEIWIRPRKEDALAS
ncbi:MAG TPA: segregation/condensation protein A, partial [bacterium]|nr:segregation/condensation protein A [bacterium]